MATSTPTSLIICEAPGVTVFPSPNTAYTCAEKSIKLHSGTLRVILQNVPRIIETQHLTASSSNAYLEVESTEEITNLTLKDGILRIFPKNDLLPTIQLEGGQYTEVGAETIASPVSIGHDIAARDLVAANIFSRATILPIGALVASLLGIAVIIFLLSRRHTPETNSDIR